jgi:transposase
MSKRNTYNTEFKVTAVARMLADGEAPGAVSRDLGVTMTQLKTWRLEFLSMLWPGKRAMQRN